jgi:putative hydroxymethylpyrimidine transport system ATP-binding protein
VLRETGLTYAGQVIFKDLDLVIPAGLTTCLLGRSGVGKTSLLRLIAGLAESASGHVADGEGQPLAGRCAYMAQQDLLLPWLSVAGNVALGARLRGEKRAGADQRALELLEQVGLRDQAGVRPAALSGGMRQRAALARTLYEERPVVLMDEPFSALDAITRYEIQALAAELLAGSTVLLITHDPLEALRLGDRILVMAGRPARLGEPVMPPGKPPRPAGAAAVRDLHGALLERLAHAHALS